MSAADLIASYDLKPHPFEGYWRETAHTEGQERVGLQLLRATDEAGWHRFPATIRYELIRGGPVVISLSLDGKQVRAERLSAQGAALTVEAAAYRALSCLGAHSLMRLTLRPGAPLTDRQLMPDTWYPKP